jgi:hypothetical protein
LKKIVKLGKSLKDFEGLGKDLGKVSTTFGRVSKIKKEFLQVWKRFKDFGRVLKIWEEFEVLGKSFKDLVKASEIGGEFQTFESFNNFGKSLKDFRRNWKTLEEFLTT